MKKSTFLIIVSITGLALVGIIFIQFYWIRNVMQLKEKMFDNSVRIALKSAVNQIYECKTDTCYSQLFCSHTCRHQKKILSSGINIETLDSLIEKEFAQVNIKKPYVYGIYNSKTKEVEYISAFQHKKDLLNSSHCASLSCVYKDHSIELGAWFPDEKQRLLSSIWWWLLLSGLLLIVLVLGFIFNIYSFLRQKKISEMKSDFVNNITHEFKTPIATISLASEMLLKPSILNSEEKARKYAGIIYDENIRLKNQVENVLQLTVLEKGTFNLKFNPFDLHQLINKTSLNFQLILKESKGKLKLDLRAKDFTLLADAMHIENVLVNLLDNANKYSQGQPDITISTYNRNSSVVIVVEDKGIGISAENQKNVFRKMYRVPTGNVHDVKGFGIGLYYVKTIVEAHNGEVSLHSQPGKGSRFEISIPIKAH